MKVTPHLTFEVDRVFEQATRVESLLREIATEPHPRRGRPARDGGTRHADEDRRAGRGAEVSTGVLVIDKPIGPTSFDVVRQVRRALGTRRAGHGGTLDPMASGVLPICLGEATKLAQFLLDADKEYEATLCFGVETDTYDATGYGDPAAGRRRPDGGRRSSALSTRFGARSGRCRRGTRR